MTARREPTAPCACPSCVQRREHNAEVRRIIENANAKRETAMTTGKRAATKDTRDLFRKVEAQGCKVERLGSGHYRISKDGDLPTVTMSGTRTSSHTQARQRSLLRKLLGVVV
jgi:hypothetical protein